MKHLVFLGPGRLQFESVPEPTLEGPRDALVRPVAVARCDLDAVFMTGPVSQGLRGVLASHMFDPVGYAVSNDPPYAPPFPVGHECVAEVVALGRDVGHVKLGDRVVVPFTIACGLCRTCGRGLTSRCETTPHVNYFGFGVGARTNGGVLADLVRVPYADHMLVPVPEGVDSVAVASASDNLADAYRAVAGPLAEMPDVPVLVVGGQAKSVGLYAAAVARALGASDVDYCDDDRERLAIAERIGVRAIEAPSRTRMGAYRPLPRKYLVGVDAASDLFARGLELVLRSLAPGGICTAVGIYPMHRTPLPLMQMYVEGLSLRTGVTNAHAIIPKVLDLVADGSLDPRPVASVVASWDDAPEALTTVTTKVIITRGAAAR